MQIPLGDFNANFGGSASAPTRQIHDHDQRLIDACRAGDYDAALKALEDGANPSVKFRLALGEITPIFLCSSKGYKNIAELLIEHRADINRKMDFDGTICLHEAASNDQAEMCGFLISKGCYVDQRDKSGRTPLMDAAEIGSIETIDILMSNNADINGEDREHHTALSYALEYISKTEPKYFNCAVKLVDWGANPNYPSKYTNMTLLHYAAAFGNLELVQQLVEVNRAAIQVYDTEGKTPLNYAMELKHQDVYEYLFQQTESQNTTWFSLKKWKKTFKFKSNKDSKKQKKKEDSLDNVFEEKQNTETVKNNSEDKKAKHKNEDTVDHTFEDWGTDEKVVDYNTFCKDWDNLLETKQYEEAEKFAYDGLAKCASKESRGKLHHHLAYLCRNFLKDETADDALGHYLLSLKGMEVDGELHFNLANSLLERGILHLSRTIELNPDHDEAKQLHNIELHKKEYEAKMQIMKQQQRVNDAEKVFYETENHVLKKEIKDLQQKHRIDSALSVYYVNNGRSDYFNDGGKGKFMVFLEKHKLIQSNIHKIDEKFPLKTQYDNNAQRNEAIYKILQHCYNHGVAPKEEEESKSDEDEGWKDRECKSIDDCNRTKDIINALKYFGTLADIDNDDTKQDLVKYCKETYPSILDDYIHILDAHDNNKDLDKIFNLLINEYEFSECNIDNCALSLRYYRNRNEDIEEEKTDEQDEDFLFYRGLMDQIHCYLYHMYDTGMRVRRDDIKEDDNPFEDDYIDYEFKKMHKEIKSKLQQMREINGMNTKALESSKFNISTIEKEKEDHTATFMDGLLKLMDKTQNISNEKKNILKVMLGDEAYDTDAIDMDILTDFNDSNIGSCGHDVYNMVKECIYDAKLFTYTFSTGFRFYYWEHYKGKSELEEQEEWNINDHGGYKIQELFIEKKYKNIKVEILNNKQYQLKFFQLKQAIHKAYQYLQTQKAKKTGAFEDEFNDRSQYLHYHIHKGDPITKEHLVAIILYCDYSELSAKFTQTFRKKSSYQILSSVKQNNAEFANWSKLLRETVEMFGKSPQSVNRLCGPFFCGMSFVMVIPEYNIRLCGPTSTSKCIEVAARFAGDDGIVIQLNNPDDELSAFSCNWLSNYASEEEYLFCGGYERIKIESIRKVETSENFHPFFRALFCFDKMINSNFITNEMDVPSIIDEDYLMLDNLINHKLGNWKNKYPQYINNTFESFINNKSQIVLNLYNMHRYFSKISELIIEPQSSGTNLFKPILLKLFKNIKSIIIQSTEEIHENPFDLSLLSSILDSHLSINTTITIKGIHQLSQPFWAWDVDHNGGSWISQVFDDSVKQQYKTKGLNIKFHQKIKVGNVDTKDDCLEISVL